MSQTVALFTIGTLITVLGATTSFILTIIWQTTRDHSKRIRDLEVRVGTGDK